MTRLKNIVIWALVIVNAFFLAFSLGRMAKEHAEKKEMMADLSALFERNGIQMDAATIREGGELAGLLISRDIAEERQMAEALLGPVEMAENGGIYTYDAGRKGQAVFRSGGAFDITFFEHIYGGATSAVNTAKSLLQTMGIETVRLDADGERGNETVTAVCSWERRPIYNCRIRFDFNDGSLVHISGTYVAQIKATADKTDMSSCATSMMFFLNEVRNGRITCSRILGVEPGYKLKAAGDAISAVWRVETEPGIYYYVDATTGYTEPDA